MYFSEQFSLTTSTLLFLFLCSEVKTKTTWTTCGEKNSGEGAVDSGLSHQEHSGRINQVGLTALNSSKTEFFC